MADLTAIILTKNEELNIARCIDSIKSLAQRIIVVDSLSTDKTVEIARGMGVDIYTNPFVHYAAQFNWGLDNTGINTKWILRIDADEVLPEALIEEIEEMTKFHKYDDVNGFIMKFKVFFMERWIKHGDAYPFRKMTVFKYGTARFENKKMDEHVELHYGRSMEFNNDALHYDFKDLNHWVAKHNWYATRAMQEYLDKQQPPDSNLGDKKLEEIRRIKIGYYYRLPMFFRALLYFCYRYYIKLGFLDGKEGLIFHFLQAFWYRFLVDAKIYEHLKTGKVYGETGDLKI